MLKSAVLFQEKFCQLFQTYNDKNIFFLENV